MFVIADQQRSALRQPIQASFHYSATWFATIWPPRPPAIYFNGPDVRHITVAIRYIVPSRIVVPTVQAKILLVLVHIGTLDDDGRDCRFEQIHIRDVGPGDNHPQRSTVAFDQERLLGAVLAAIKWVLAHIFPPEPGFAQSTVRRLPAPVHRPEFVAFLDQGRPDLLKDAVAAPPLEPAVDRAVVTEVFGQLVPLASRAEPEDYFADRQLIRERPRWALGFGGAFSQRIGSIRSQSSSLISQMVSRGLPCSWTRPIRASPRT